MPDVQDNWHYFRVIGDPDVEPEMYQHCWDAREATHRLGYDEHGILRPLPINREAKKDA
jgi:hypothetical protein